MIMMAFPAELDATTLAQTNQNVCIHGDSRTDYSAVLNLNVKSLVTAAKRGSNLLGRTKGRTVKGVEM